LVFAASLLMPAAFGQRWNVAFFHDEPESQIVLQDLVFPSAAVGFAAGIQAGRRESGVLVRTSDGGKTWAVETVRDNPLSLFFLNEQHGWMVGSQGVWKTEDGGGRWRRIVRRRGLVRVHFLDENNGWAVGLEKQFLRTSDGGRRWEKVPIVDEVTTEESQTYFNWIEFATPRFGIVVGNHAPERAELSRLPEWMEPELSRRRQVPTTLIVIQTMDGGQTWKPSVASVFGQMTRLRLLPDGRGLSLVEFVHQFQYPSEVFRLQLADNKTTRVYRQADRKVTDALLLPDGSAMIVAVEVPGDMPTLPIPGRLRVLRTSDYQLWREVDVDYRAVARRAILAAAPGGRFWMATSEGMILRLDETTAANGTNISQP
jgi:hypothetical protein